MDPVLATTAGISTVGALVFNGIGLGHLLVKSPTTIVEEARQELSSALAILDTFHAVIDNDLMAPLIGRYDMLDMDLRDLEQSFRARSFTQKFKSFKRDRHAAVRTRLNSKRLYLDVQAASDTGVFAGLLRKTNLTSHGQPVPPTPHPIYVASCSGPLRSEEHQPMNLSTTTFHYPPHLRQSLASIVSDPFKDPSGTATTL